MTDPVSQTRRDFLYPATAAVGAVALGAAIWGLGGALSPSQDQVPRLTIDLSGLAEGAEVTVKFLGRPVLIRHRSIKDIAGAEADDSLDFIDPFARNLNLAPDAPATDANRRATADGRFLVTSQVCTHLGCVVIGDRAGDFGGFFCPCHGAHFDTAGRVRKGPPPHNLPIPALAWPKPGILTLFAEPRMSPAGLDSLIYG